jgi:Rrf2 family protein
MLSLSSRSIYGITALYELALAYGKAQVQTKRIAESHSIPEDYLRQLLLILKSSNLVDSVRGTGGGYILSRPPSKISIIEALECLEGPTNLNKKDGVRDRVLCSYWSKCESEIQKVFSQTLEDLVHQKQKLDGNSVYHI